MRVRSNHAVGTGLTITLPDNLLSSLDNVLSTLIKAGHRGLYFTASEKEVFILITSYEQSRNKDSNYFTTLLAHALPGTVVKEAKSSRYSLDNLTSYTSFIARLLLSIQSDSIALVGILNAVLRSNQSIRGLSEKKLQGWVEANKPKKPESNPFGVPSSMFDDDMHTGFSMLGASHHPMHASHHSPFGMSHSNFGGSSHHHSSMGFFEQQQRADRERIERQNQQIIFESSLQSVTDTYQLSYVCKVEALHHAAHQLVQDIINNNISTKDAIYQRCQLFLAENGGHGLPLLETCVSQATHADVHVHLHHEDDTFRHFDKSALNQYYAEVNAYFDEILHMTELDVNTERLYNPRTQETATLKLMGVNVTPEARLTFLFDLQLALLSSGLLPRFTVNVMLCRDARMLFQQQVSDLEKKYALPDISYESLEKCLRESIIRGQLNDFHFLLENMPLNINSKDSDPALGYTALHHAVKSGQVIFVRALLEKGAKYDIAAADGSTALSMAEAYGANSAMRELFGAPQAVVVDEVKEAASRLSGMKM
jgi:ankyrin repeat protein